MNGPDVRDPAGWRAVPEPVPLWRSWRRKIVVLARITRRGGPARPAAELQRSYEAHGAVPRTDGVAALVDALWSIEQEAFQHFEAGGRAMLRDRHWPVEIGPPAHCGLAMASVLLLGFDSAALRRELTERSDPRFVFFAYESVGAALGVYQQDLPSRLAGLLGRLGLMRHTPLPPVDTGAFLADWDEPERKLMAHGFGRLTYFKSHGLRRTVRHLLMRPEVPLGSAIRGAVSALGLVNHQDLERVFGLTGSALPPELRDALEGGLRNLVRLLEWSAPGVLDGVEIPERARDLVTEERRFAHRARASGEGPQLVA